MSDQTPQIKAELERAKETVQEAKRDVSAAIDQKRGGPAADVDDAERKLAALRSDIDRDITSLRARIPDTDEVANNAKVAGIVGVGGLAVVGVVITLAKRRGAAKHRDEAIRVQAIALARELARVDAQRLVEEDAEDGGNRRRWWVAFLGILAAVGAVMWQRTRAAVDIPADDVWGPEEQPPLTPVPPG